MSKPFILQIFSQAQKTDRITPLSMVFIDFKRLAKPKTSREKPVRE